MYGQQDYDKTYVSLFIEQAQVDSQNVQSARWTSTGTWIQKNQTPDGYLSDGFMLQNFPSMMSLDMGTGDNTPGTLALPLRQPDSEVDTKLSSKASDFFIFTIRNWKQVVTEKRLYVNDRTMAIWGRIIEGMTNEMMIGVEVHTVAEKLNDGSKVTLNSADCMTNTRVGNHSINRLPRPIEPHVRTGAPQFDQWSSNLTSW